METNYQKMAEHMHIMSNILTDLYNGVHRDGFTIKHARDIADKLVARACEELHAPKETI